MDTTELFGGEDPGSAANRDEARVRAKQVMARADERVRALVAEHPVGTLLGAAAIGYLLGRLLFRR